MDRRTFTKAALAGGIGSAVAAPAIAQSSPTIKWRCASAFPKNLTISHEGTFNATQRIGELTEGKFQIQFFGPGEIVPAAQVLDAVQNGTVEMGISTAYSYVGKDPTFGFASVLPFGLNTRQQIAWMLRGDGQKLTNDFFKTYNIYSHPIGQTGAQMGGWYRKEIKSLEDMKGLKMRISGLAGEIMKRMGVVPQGIPPGDIYPALERGTIDAVEYVGPFDDEKLGLYKVAKYYYYPGWWEGNVLVSNFMNLNKWNELPPHYKRAVEVACTESMTLVTAGYDAKNGAALRNLVGLGAELRPFPRDMLSEAYGIAFDYYDEVAAKNESFKTIYENWKAFREDILLWHRISEASYDNFIYAEHARRKR